MLIFLDILFFVVHTGLILFNLLGWIWPRTRPYHLATMGLTALSWLGLGYWYGWGYCLCTDWHLGVRARLGYPGGDVHYLQLLARILLGLHLTPGQGSWIAGSTFVGIILATLTVHVRAHLRDREGQRCQLPTSTNGAQK